MIGSGYVATDCIHITHNFVVAMAIISKRLSGEKNNVYIFHGITCEYSTYGDPFHWQRLYKQM